MNFDGRTHRNILFIHDDFGISSGRQKIKEQKNVMQFTQLVCNELKGYEEGIVAVVYETHGPGRGDKRHQRLHFDAPQ